jgi:hypothetical protein
VLYPVVEREIELGSDPIEYSQMMSARLAGRYDEILNNLTHCADLIEEI